jgi:transcriptional regulator with XRE-family HTH domain
MDPIRFARQLRALRIRRELRQEDVARIAGISRSVVSRLELGRIESTCVRTLQRAAAAVGATIEIRLRWNGEQLDRLLDEAHARIVNAVVVILRASGWDVAVEVSFAIYGERGSIDVFAFHRRTGIVLVVEVKSVVPDSQAALHGLDRKARLAPRMAAERGWRCRGVARLLVVGDTATSHRRVARLAATYAVAFPIRGRDVRRWLRDPQDPVSGLLFVAYGPRGSVRRTGPARERVRVRGRRKGTGLVGANDHRVSV